jgi:hypothetical protein
MPSLCTANITHNYFKDGTLPPDGHICPVDKSPFPDPDAAQKFTDGDATMLEYLSIIDEAMNRMRWGQQM